MAFSAYDSDGNYIGWRSPQNRAGNGSGVIVEPCGTNCENNTYLLTAAHVLDIEDDPSNDSYSLDGIHSANEKTLLTYSDVVFNYERSYGTGTGSEYQTIIGLEYVLGDAAKDFLLLKLSSQPPSSYNVEYAGYDS